MWLQRRDIRFSAQGYAKAMQHGAVAGDMAEALSACIRCGACDRLCPQQIDLSGMIAAALKKTQSAEVPEVAADWFAISCSPAVRQHVRADDFYMIEASAFHANHRQRVVHYEKLRQATGCSMNLDLNRMAIATGIGSAAVSLQSFDVRKQIEWLLQGRSFQRMIVENPADQSLLAEITGKPVLHLSELLALSGSAHA